MTLFSRVDSSANPSAVGQDKPVPYSDISTIFGSTGDPLQPTARAVVAAILMMLPVAAARAQPGEGAPRRASGNAVRAVKAPIIDGREDDDVWKLATPITGFRQFDPGEDLDATFRTEFKVAYDDRYLYVLVRAYDPHPDSIISLLSRRDVKTPSDQLKIIIDAFHDGRTGVEMAVNPAGVKRDFSIYSDVIEDPSWDGVWDVGVRVDSLGWVAEFRVPFSQLRFNSADVHEFGFGVWRDIARLNERDAWPAYRMSSSTLISQLGTVQGIRGIAPARRLELLPYMVSKSVPDRVTPGAANRNEIAGGLDVKAGLTPNVTVDATINPDFGQVEADPAVLNLSAFEIAFPEQRPFFQEGIGLYNCGGPCEGPFYTRRIGRAPQLATSSADPAFTAILGAAKVTGRFDNGVAIGIVDAVTRRERGVAGTTIEPQTNYFAFRALREWRDGRTEIGLMALQLNRELDSATSPFLRRSASTLMLQGHTRFARDRWDLMAYTGLNQVDGSAAAIAATQQGSVHYYQRPDHEERYDSTRTSLGGHAIGLELSKISGWFRYDGFYRYATPGLELNDMGFVPLVNDVQVRQTFDFQQLTPSRWIRASFSEVSAESHWTVGGLPATRLLFLHTSAQLHNNWGGALTATISEIGGPYCVSCARGGPVLRQSLKQGIRFDLGPDLRPAIVPHAVFRVGRSDEGRSWYRGGEAGVDVRVASRFSATLYGSYDRVANDQQWVANYGALLSDTTHYTFARLDQDILALTARANWTATPNLSVQLYAQPFVTAGTYSDWRELAASRAAQYSSRFRAYGAGATPDGFNVKQFNSNLVVRWEYRPASVLFLVWQQGRSQSDLNPGSFAAPRDVRDLFAAHGDNTVLLKLSWWLNP
jgi:hypothetical protein